MFGFYLNLPLVYSMTVIVLKSLLNHSWSNVFIMLLRMSALVHLSFRLTV